MADERLTAAQRAAISAETNSRLKARLAALHATADFRLKAGAADVTDETGVRYGELERERMRILRRARMEDDGSDIKAAAATRIESRLPPHLRAGFNVATGSPQRHRVTGSYGGSRSSEAKQSKLGDQRATGDSGDGGDAATGDHAADEQDEQQEEKRGELQALWDADGLQDEPGAEGEADGAGDARPAAGTEAAASAAERSEAGLRSPAKQRSIPTRRTSVVMRSSDLIPVRDAVQEQRVGALKEQLGEYAREYVDRFAQSTVYSASEPPPFDLPVKLLINSVVWRININYTREKFLKQMLLPTTRGICVDLFWLLHCMVFQSESEWEQEVLVESVARRYMQLLSTLGRANRDHFLAALPYAAAATVYSAFHYCVPGSRAEYTPSFRLQLYVVVIRLLSGLEMAPLAVLHEVERLFPDEAPAPDPASLPEELQMMITRQRMRMEETRQAGSFRRSATSRGGSDSFRGAFPDSGATTPTGGAVAPATPARGPLRSLKSPLGSPLGSTGGALREGPTSVGAATRNWQVPGDPGSKVEVPIDFATPTTTAEDQGFLGYRDTWNAETLRRLPLSLVLPTPDLDRAGGGMGGHGASVASLPPLGGAGRPDTAASLRRPGTAGGRARTGPEEEGDAVGDLLVRRSKQHSLDARFNVRQTSTLLRRFLSNSSSTRGGGGNLAVSRYMPVPFGRVGGIDTFHAVPARVAEVTRIRKRQAAVRDAASRLRSVTQQRRQLLSKEAAALRTAVMNNGVQGVGKMAKDIQRRQEEERAAQIRRKEAEMRARAQARMKAAMGRRMGRKARRARVEQAKAVGALEWPEGDDDLQRLAEGAEARDPTRIGLPHAVASLRPAAAVAGSGAMGSGALSVRQGSARSRGGLGKAALARAPSADTVASVASRSGLPSPSGRRSIAASQNGRAPDPLQLASMLLVQSRGTLLLDRTAAEEDEAQVAGTAGPSRRGGTGGGEGAEEDDADSVLQEQTEGVPHPSDLLAYQPEPLGASSRPATTGGLGALSSGAALRGPLSPLRLVSGKLRVQQQKG